MIHLSDNTRQQLLDYVSGPSEWLQVTQEQIDHFGRCTFDDQFIHVDPEKAKDSPFGTTIAHGFLLLSLQTFLARQCAPPIANVAWALNYGLNRVRFLTPVPVDSWIRTVARITDVTEKRPGSFLITTEATLEMREQDKPAMVAELLGLVVTDGT